MITTCVIKCKKFYFTTIEYQHLTPIDVRCCSLFMGGLEVTLHAKYKDIRHEQKP